MSSKLFNRWVKKTNLLVLNFFEEKDGKFSYKLPKLFILKNQ